MASIDFKGLWMAMAMALMLPAAGCKKTHNPSGDFPDGFGSMSDRAKVAFMMENVAPDSVARFLVNASSGMIEGVRIDTLATATLYAYEGYKDKDFELFSTEYDQYVQRLPLDRKMAVYKAGASEDPQQMGYTLGLEYIGNIREQSKSVDEVRAELAAFRKACGSDTDTYRRFLTGFRTALQADRGKDLPEEIYTAFINYQ